MDNNGVQSTLYNKAIKNDPIGIIQYGKGYLSTELEEKIMKEQFRIYDGSAESQKAKAQAKSLNGFHPLFTASARRSIVLNSLKIWMLVGFVVGVVTGIAVNAGLTSVLLGLFIAVVIYFGFRNDVYQKVYAPDHDRGQINLPEGMSWEEAVARIRRGFANPDVEQVTDTAEAMTFYSKKCGTYQLKNTADGLKMTILSKPSKSSKKEYLYAVFGSVLLSQVIAILYPEKISAAQVEEEKSEVRKLFKAHKMPLLIELAIAAAFIVFAGYMFYNLFYSDSARSKNISDSYLPQVFPAEATVGEVLDDFFANGKWENYEQDGVTFVHYSGECANTQTGEKTIMGFYFKLEDDSFSIDRMTWDGETMNLLERYAVLSKISESYCKNHGIASSNALDDAFNELENALNDAFADSSSNTSMAEPASEPESETYTNDTASNTSPRTAARSDRKLIGTNGVDTYSELSGDISVDINSYEIGEMPESTKEYYLSYGNDFDTAWLNAMYTDVYEYSGKYSNLDAWDRFTQYIAFYDEVVDYNNELAPAPGLYDVYYAYDPDTEEEAGQCVGEVIQIAEESGAEIQFY